VFKNNSVYCTQVRHGIVQSLHWISTMIEFLDTGNRWQWLSTTCSSYCFCSSWFVI